MPGPIGKCHASHPALPNARYSQLLSHGKRTELQLGRTSGMFSGSNGCLHQMLGSHPSV
jgi:hypothetical protein